jgi:hypothetical protein
MSLPTIAEVYARWHNPNCGFELEPDRNIGPPATSENGILFHAIFLMLLDMLNLPYQETKFPSDTFFTDVISLETSVAGVFDRGVKDSELIPANLRNENSQDNYIAICCGLFYSRFNYRSYTIRKSIADHGLKHFFIYNNVKPRISLPMNPGNWSVFLAAAEDHTFLTYLFLPFFILNFYITNFLMPAWESFKNLIRRFKKLPEEKPSTSNKQLYLILLYSLRKQTAFRWLYNIYVRKMRKIFGENFIEEMFKIYYNNPNHPNRLYAAGIILQEQK